MDHAWLHSLSEDWVSQHPSSGSPAPSLPSLGDSVSSTSRATSSRIPKYNPQKQAWTAANDAANSPLSERSLNEHNVPLSQRSQRQSSKLREVTNGDRGRRLSRTLSASTTQSVQYHTIQHKSLSLSPKKERQETPEWKRRLLHGEVAYGEQRDLFSAAGLETIFQPPPETSTSPNKLPTREFDDVGSVAMPSSPPLYDFERDQMTEERRHDEDNSQRRQQPRAMKYRLADSDGSDFSTNDLSRGSSFQLTSRSVRGNENPAHLSEPASEMESSALQHRDIANGAGRTASGQSDVRNEELSPIFISRHNTIDGKIDYAALNLPADELQKRMEDIREESSILPNEDQHDVSEPLPVDMTIETDDFAHNGRFVNLQRGGHSQEGSFQKRMLSPSSLPAIDESAMLPEESMQASTPKQLCNMKRTRSSSEYQQAPKAQGSPQTPSTSPSKPAQKEQQSSSGSPLKLFGTYDTFTNQKLLRRLSQFAGDLEDVDSHESSRPEMNEAFVAQSSATSVSRESQVQRASTRLNSFGKGDLDDFPFSEEVSYNSSTSTDEDEDKENITLPLLNPEARTTFKFQLEPSPALEDDVVLTNRTKYTSTTRTSKHVISVRKTRPGTSSSEFSTDMHPSQRQEDLHTPRKRNGDSEGKRLQRTPLKDPTPKRRRTLQKLDTDASDDDQSLALDSLRETHQQMQSVIGRKRKDARHDDDQQAANPKVLAMRQILRPRTPTPSQRSSLYERQPLAEIDSFTERARMLQDEKIAKIQAELDSTNPLKMSVALGLSQQMQNESRKGSVTTQDFLDEAKKIMAGIRDKVRPRSGLTSLEESESENDKNQSPAADYPEGEFEDSYQESTKEPFSRPPSRDGKPIPRLPMKQEDPALLDHLRKYQEKSDMDVIIASSMKSLALAKEASNIAREADRMTNETISRASGHFISQDIRVESDPPNVRISENPDFQRKRKHSTSSIPSAGEGQEAEFPSHGSNSSSGQSTSRSIPTGSSRGSDSRRVIPPHTVSHLIPEQVAGMVFDRERNIWIKRKSVSGEKRHQNFLPSDETEDDPFGDIPDLSVDETQERQRIKAVDAKRKEDARVAQEHHEEEERKVALHSHCIPHKRQSSNTASDLDRDLSEPSKLAHLRSSEDMTEPATRLTSWGEEQNYAPSQAHYRTESFKEQHKIESRETREEFVEEVEKEISILEDRVDPTTPRRRNVTITFSSPLASIIKPTNYEDEDSSQPEVNEASESDDEPSNGSVVITKNRSRTASTTMRSAMRSASRLQSLRGHNFSARPVSRIDEQDEDSTDKDNEIRDRSSISIVVSAPLPHRREASIVLSTPRPAHEVGTLTLTPLSDFTVHHGDQSLGLDVSYIAQNQRHLVGNEKKKTLSHSIKQLVERLTDVEPYEPFWEHLKKLELKNKGLTNLHKLNEFCEELEDLDVSHNQLGELDGIPRTIRHLRVTYNCLTELTAWGHLSNLQYIDVSNNSLESLSAFKFLIHLRGLTADNNRIQSLDGVNQLDGLLNLRLRRNAIQTCDFGSTMLQRLTELDLASNQITDVRNIQELRSLSMLNLDDNHISDISVDGSDALWSLAELKLSGNNLASFNVSGFPNLRLLHLDRNRLGVVTGLLQTKCLDSLSMREQQEGSILDQSFINEVFEVRKLSLSGNYLGSFQPHVEFLNLQYLELANCGLDSLPDDFGLLVANVRVLNLNFNALKDLKPLLGIRRLRKLHLAGNRILRLRTTARVLGHFPHMTLADIRGNPLTVGFYPAMAETRMVVSGGDDDADPQDSFVLDRADRERDAKYIQRLDMQTKMLRRTFEILVLGDCPRLRIFDGLDVDMSVVIRKDSTWQALVDAGVLRVPSLDKPALEEQKGGDMAIEEAVPEEQAVEESEDKSTKTSARKSVGKSVEIRLERSTQNLSEESILQPSEMPVEEPEEEERWPAEDSFA
ncbi:hypothetical protein EG329_010276 [Mollisiaceae sp. DMI_Dod_QoI]|nr:hypothetical protein EG329_010276 [Helotiales sp. DMI_Dod_QoI]